MKKPGPKPSGVKTRVLYRRLPETSFDAWVKILDKLEGADGGALPVSLASEPVVAETHTNVASGEVEALKTNQKALLGDVERLTREVGDLRLRLDRCSRAGLDDKGRWWMQKFLALEQQVKSKSSVDQE